MSIQRRSLSSHEFDRVLQRSCPQKLKLIHARPFNCTGGNCFQNGRGTISGLCNICGGTGYIGGSQSDSMTAPPYADFYFIYGDLQIGHGLYGAGGDYLRLIADIGKQQIGDATLFTKYFDIDRQTGKKIYPVIDETLPRPDVIISLSGQPYNIVREMSVEIGSEQIARIYTCERGSFSPSGASQGR